MTIPHNGFPVPRETLIDFFRDLAEADGAFLVHDDGFRTRTFTYREVGAASRAFAARLGTTGLRKGDKVVFFSENRPEWIVAFWGCLLAGVVVVPIDYRSSPDFLTRVSRIVAASLVLVGQDVPPLEANGPPVWNLRDIEWTDADAPDVQVSREDVAEIIFTSGATAEPKGVVISHKNVLANIVPVEREILKYRRWGRPFFPLKFLNLLPLSHMFGQAMATFIPPMLPGVVIFMRGYNPGDIVALMKSRRVSVLVSVPKILDVLRHHVARRSPDTAASDARASGRPLAAGSVFRTLKRIARRWWRYRDIHRMLGFKFWAFVVGAAPLEPELEAFWGDRGFAVIQGYGLTETAPIVTLNHPFGTQRGSVGKAIAGVEVKIAPNGEILVRGENVTGGYFGAEQETARAFEGGWFHTGDIGERGPDGELFIRGRKKEMIVTPEGLNIFPEDIEHVLNRVPGVRESAVVGIAGNQTGSDERVHAVVVVEQGTDVDRVTREANALLADYQRIRRTHVWPEPTLPRTEGTRKLKRAAIREWVRSGGPAPGLAAGADALETVLHKYSGRGQFGPEATIDELGLSSLERVELMVALEDAYQTRLDESTFAKARRVSDLRTLLEHAGETLDEPPAAEPVSFPSWNRSWPARVVRRASLPTWILPLARVFAWVNIEGLEHVRGLKGPVVFASNHQSHMDTPVIMNALPTRWRYRLAPAMAKEFFKAHFFPDQFTRRQRLTNSLNYFLAALFFNAFPLPQREAGARQTLRYIGDVLADGFSVLIFPEGRRAETGAIEHFRPGIGMIASRLNVPVVPVRLDNVDRVLHPSWRMAKPGPVRVAFGAPLRLSGDDYEALARRVETAVRELGTATPQS